MPAARSGSGPSADALWQAFCQGAGVDPSLAATLDETMRRMARKLKFRVLA